MGKFISGTILAVVSAAFFGFGTVFLLTAIGATSFGEAIAGIILIPLALCAYAAELVTGGIAEGLLWSNFACRGRGRVAGAVIAILCALMMVCSIAFFAYLMISSGSTPE